MKNKFEVVQKVVTLKCNVCGEKTVLVDPPLWTKVHCVNCGVVGHYEDDRLSRSTNQSWF